MTTRRLFERDPLGLLIFSGQQLFRDLPVWIQINLWGLLLSVPLLSIPAARAAIYFAVEQQITDRIDGAFTPRQAFFAGFRRHFLRSTLAATLNLLIGALIVFSLFFWVNSPVAVLNYLAAVSIYFLLFWLVCQPFVFPILLAVPEQSPIGVLRLTVRLVVSTPLYALLTALLVFGINLIGIVLLGPVLLVLGTFVALLTTQALWVMTDRPLPVLQETDHVS